MAHKLRTVTDIKTAVRSKVRGKPRLRGSEFLERFILEKNKARLEQEKENVEKRKIEIQKDISVINEELKRLEDEISELKGVKEDGGNRENHKRIVPTKPMKAMTIDY